MDELERIVRDGCETLSVEFKGPISWNDASTKAKVVKAAIAMANKRDGGLLVVGMSEASSPPGHHIPAGLSPDQVESFKPDEIMAFVNSHATPSVDLTVSHREFEGHSIVAIAVR